MSNWIQQSSGTTNSLSSVWGFSSSDVYACGGNTVIHWNGTAWSTESVPIGDVSWTAVWGPNSGSVYVFSSTGRVAHKSSGVWVDLGFVTVNGNQVGGAWGTADNNIWALQQLGVLEHSSNSGATWSSTFTDGTATSGPIRGVNASAIFATAAVAAIYFYNGTSWSKVTAPQTLNDAWPDTVTSGYALASGLIYRFSNSGSTMIEMIIPDTNFTARSVFGSSASVVYAAGRFTSSGNVRVLALGSTISWVDDFDITLSGNPRQVWSAADGSAFVVGDSGMVVAKLVASPSLISAVAISTNTVQVNVSGSPLARSPIGTGDALNPDSWSLFRVDTAADLDVMAVTQVSSNVFNITIYELFPSFNVLLNIGTTLIDKYGNPINVNALNFPGTIAAQISTPARQLAQQRQVQDLLNVPAPNDTSTISGVLPIGASGDYLRQWGTPLVKKLYFRRLTTKPREFFHLPIYGLGLSVNEPLPTGDAQKLRANVEAQLKLEPETDQVQAPITLDAENQIVTIDINAKLLDGSTVDQSIPFPGQTS